MKIALITGATSGIGEAIALKFAQKDINVIITGRRLDKLNALKSNITSNTKANILALKMDVTDRKSVERVINGLPDEWKSIDILVNNAGLAVGLDPIQHGNPGHVPFSKETSVVMMADSVEAASRSLKVVDEKSISTLVDKIIDKQVESGQFSNSNITLRDITQIRKILKRKLMNIYHLRIEYPG
jgi:NADP-dependent 3-hydroxy acid dehydrogenase YdfG